MAVRGTHLLLLAYIIVQSESLTCNDVTCCPGTVCVERHRNGATVAKCVTATSCDQLDCPNGFECVNETQGSNPTHQVASCQASCDDVSCPGFLQCEEEGSTTECVVPDECSLVQCPSGTECKIVEKGDMRAAVCLGESCASVNCFAGSECFIANKNSLDAAIHIFDGPYPTLQRDDTGGENGGGSRGTGSGQEEGSGQQSTGQQSSGQQSSGQQGSGVEESGEEESGQPGSGGSGQQGGGQTGGGQQVDVAICLPTCEGANICPEGFVCEEDDYKLVCREAQSCFELRCPAGQECQEVTCGSRRVRRSSTGTKPTPGTQGNVLVSCVDVPGGENNAGEAQSSLERIGNEGEASITNGASSLSTSKQGTLLSAVTALALTICAFLLLPL